MATYEGQVPAYGVRDFPRKEGETFAILKPKTDGTPKDKLDYVATEDEAGTYWLLRNNTRANVQFEIEITP